MVNVARAAKWQAARIAVLGAFGRDWTAPGQCAPIFQALERLRTAWIIQLRKLTELRWSGVSGDTVADDILNAKFMRQCPPFGVMLAGKGLRPCNRRNICPFCYARAYVVRSFEQLEKVLYGTNKPFKEGGDLFRCAGGWYATSVRKTRRHLPERKTLASLCRCAELWKSRLGVSSGRNWEVRRANAVCGVAVNWAAPSGNILFCRRGVLLLSRAPVKRASVCSHESDKFECVALDSFQRVKDKLAMMLGHSFRYPANLLRADPERVKAVLHAMSGMKQCTSFGFKAYYKNAFVEKSDGQEEVQT